jgi:hypothetical protein
VFENRVMRRIFGPKRVEVTENGENCIVGHFIICITHLILRMIKLRISEVGQEAFIEEIRNAYI